MPSRPHVIVLGDGIFGTSTAHALADAGARVTQIGRGPGSGGATWRSFAWLNAAQAVPEAYHRLRLLSLSRYRTWAQGPAGSAIHFPGALAWERDGATVQLLQGAEEVEPVAGTYRRLRDLGHDVRSISAAAAQALEPALASESLAAEGILWSRDEGWVDLPALVGLLRAEFPGRYVQSRATLLLDDAGTASVRLADGTVIAGDAVVVAAGASTRPVFAEVGIPVPERSTKAALLFTEPAPIQPRMLLRTPAGSVRPRPGGGLVVHTSDVESQVRIDESGQVVLDDPAVIDAALERVAGCFRGDVRLALDRVALGMRPIPGDGLPIVGRVAGTCFVAFSHSGATLGPIIGELLAGEVLGTQSPLLAPFRPGRFA
ncbi:MAG TPA: FAD-binding oxidoreductase [Mycobacteriales bacterium]|nr:FAD-binding oxidoreductase [Mycobacteriales bacterium]